MTDAPAIITSPARRARVVSVRLANSRGDNPIRLMTEAVRPVDVICVDSHVAMRRGGLLAGFSGQ